ncbi:unnamed protein product [Protopolystoma xenopodis]|uniref:Uncharacterized protein n=1 Tax=Protopolystoma xenopodis TaxID=117903 RepID=A0A448WMD3_9PLAT|nr:unnamed protein product [Protopolystoma xenopodis]
MEKMKIDPSNVVHPNENESRTSEPHLLTLPHEERTKESVMMGSNHEVHLNRVAHLGDKVPPKMDKVENINGHKLENIEMRENSKKDEKLEERSEDELMFLPEAEHDSHGAILKKTGN